MSKQFCLEDSTIQDTVILAEALADGLPLKGVGEILRVGAAGLFWWPYTGDRVGAHLYTGMNLHRYLLQLDAESFCDKRSTLLLWHPRAEMCSIYRSHEASARRCQLPWSTSPSEVGTVTMGRYLDLDKDTFAR
jgi:hypothetical protein